MYFKVVLCHSGIRFKENVIRYAYSDGFVGSFSSFSFKAIKEVKNFFLIELATAKLHLDTIVHVHDHLVKSVLGHTSYVDDVFRVDLCIEHLLFVILLSHFP